MRRNSFPALFSPVSLNPLHICYTHVSCKPPWHREERPLSQPPFSIPSSPTRADCRNYQNIWKKKKEEEEAGAEIPWCRSINHKHSKSSESPASIRDLGPSSKPPWASPTQRPPHCSQRLSRPLQDPKLPSSPAPFAPTSLSPAHKLRASSLPLSVLLTAPGHKRLFFCRCYIHTRSRLSAATQPQHSHSTHAPFTELLTHAPNHRKEFHDRTTKGEKRETWQLQLCFRWAGIFRCILTPATESLKRCIFNCLT